MVEDRYYLDESYIIKHADTFPWHKFPCYASSYSDEFVERFSCKIKLLIKDGEIYSKPLMMFQNDYGIVSVEDLPDDDFEIFLIRISVKQEQYNKSFENIDKHFDNKI